MVKKGSYVICIDNSIVDINGNVCADSCIYLTMGKVYNVQRIINVSTVSGNYIYKVINDNNIASGYYSSRFISLSEMRKMKLERIKKIK